MIARSLPAEQPPERPSGDWESQLREAYRDPRQLLEDLGLDPAGIRLSASVAQTFPFRVTRAFAARMCRGDADDPLLRQVLPLTAEDVPAAGYGEDPVGERARVGDGSLIRKYRGRALLIVTGACAIHCRYCFRRDFPYADALGEHGLDRALTTIAGDGELSEVILSGGDPLVRGDAWLARLLETLGAMPQLRRLRIHTRLPIVLPARITTTLLETFARARKPLVVVVHANHPRELDGEVIAALNACRRAGVTLLNQAVLLRGVNDAVATLAALSETLFEAGVLPYYVNLLDPVKGSAHFAVPDTEAAAIQSGLRAVLPGYLVPRFVREVPGAPAKMPFG